MNSNRLWVFIGAVAAFILLAAAVFCTGAGHGIYFPLFMSAGPFAILSGYPEIGVVISGVGSLVLWPFLFWLSASKREDIGKHTFLIIYGLSLLIGAVASVAYEVSDEGLASRMNGLLSSEPKIFFFWIGLFVVVQLLLLLRWRKQIKAL
jgi:hypothetical protein